MSTVYNFTDYKLYLNQIISELPNKGRGTRLRLSQALNCQTAFISQVLNQRVHFSLEQVVKVNSFFHHNKYEGRFFMLLVQMGRAGSKELEDYFKEEIAEILRQKAIREENRTISENLDEINLHIYYSNWYFSAIHIALSIKNLQTPLALANHFKLPMAIVNKALAFLCETGLAINEGKKYIIGHTRIHLEHNSLQVRRHHANWRSQAIENLEIDKKENYFYTNVLSISKKDVDPIMDILDKAIDDCRKIVKKSKEETVQVLNIDFFNL